MLLTLTGLSLVTGDARFQHWLGQRVAAWVQDRTGLPVSIAWIHWDVFSNVVSIGETALVGENREPWVELPLITVEFGLTRMSLTHVRLRSVTVHHPRLHVHIDENMRVEPVESILELLSAGAGPTPVEGVGDGPLLRIDIDRVQLAHADLRFSMANPPMEARFRDSDIRTEIVESIPGRLVFTLDQGTYRLFDWPYEGMKLTGEGRFADPGLLLENVHLHGDVPAIDFAVDGRIAFDEATILLLDVGGIADSSVVNLHYTSIPELVGTVTLRQELRVHSETGFSMFGWVAAESLEVQGRMVRDVYGELSMDETGMNIGPFSLRADGGSLRIRGRVEWDPKLNLVFEPQIDGLELAWLDAFFGTLPLRPQGRLRAVGKLRVVDEPALLVAVAVTGSSELRRIELMPGRPMPPQQVSLALDLEIDDDDVRFRRLAVRAPAFSTALSGTVPMAGADIVFEGSASMTDLDILSSTIGFDLAGRADGRFRFEGDRLDILASGRGVSAFGTSWEFADATIEIDGGGLRIPRLDLTTGAETLRIGLAIGESAWSAEGQTDGLSLAALGPALDLGGRLSGRIKVRGEVANFVPTVFADLRASELRWRDWSIGTVDVTARTIADRLTADIRSEGDLAGAMRVEGWPDGEIAAVVGAFEWRLPPSVADPIGLAALWLDGEGLISGGGGHGALRFGGLDDAGQLAGVVLVDERGFSLALRRSTGPLHGRGILRVDQADQRWQAMGDLIAENALRDIEGIGAHAGRLRFDFEGVGASPEGVAGTAELSAFRAVIGGVVLRQDGVARLVANRRRWSFSAPLSILIDGRGPLLAEGGVRPSDGWDIDVRGPLPLDLLLPLGLGLRDIDGEATVVAHVGGPWARPDVRGELSLAAGRAELTGFDAPFESLRGRARFVSDRLEIEELRAVWGDGGADMRGRVGLIGARGGDIDLRIGLATERVQLERRLVGGLRGHLSLIALPGRPLTIGGDVELADARYDDEIAWERAILQLRSSVIDPEFLDDGASPRLDVRVRGRRDLQVRTNLLQGQVELDGTLKGTLQVPRIYGLAEVRQGGLFFFRGQVYTIRRGIVQSIDPSGRVPFLDVEAETTVWHEARRQEYRIILTILGPVDRLQIRFQSEPPLDEVDILTLLSFGVLPEELAGEESDAQGTAGRELSTIILSGQISRIEQEIQSIIGFDRLEIEPAFSSPRSSSSMQVTLQKRLSERLRLSLSSGLEVGGEQRIELGYRILDGVDVSLGWVNRTDDSVGSLFTRPRVVFPLP